MRNCYSKILLYCTGWVLLFFFNNPVFSQGAVLDYTTPGTYTWTVPPCVTEITVQVWGGGGGGGGAIAIMRSGNGSEACSGAGGGGGYTTRTFPVTAGQTYTIQVGAGGAAGQPGNGSYNSGITTSPTNGGNGGLSSFTGNGINLQATGGTGGQFASAYNNNNSNDVNGIGNGGNGGVGSGGSASFTGGNGAGGHILNFSTDKSGGGGGGAAGPGGNGGNAQDPITNGIADPLGGIGQTPGGNGGKGRMQNLPSNGSFPGGNGLSYGGGGGGGLVHRESYDVQKAFGGSGAPGAVLISFNTSNNVVADAGPDQTISCSQSVQIGTPPPVVEPPIPGTYCGHTGRNYSYQTNVPGELTQGGGVYNNGVVTSGGTANINNTNTLVDAGNIDPMGPNAWQTIWYSDFTSQHVDVCPGTTFTVTVNGQSINNNFPFSCMLWIDWDLDGTFNNSNELHYVTGITSSPFTTTFTITVPAGLPDGDYRMRIRFKDDSDFLPGSDNACTYWNPHGTPLTNGEYYFKDEIEDYTVRLNCGNTGGTGNTNTYNWTPPTDLDDPTSPTPIASPPVTTTYTVTVTDDNGCIATDQVTVTVVDDIVPEFTIAPICEGDAFTMPTTSNNGITGTWSPSFDNTQTATYTFTPDAGQCAKDTIYEVQVTPTPDVPIVTVIDPTCDDDGYAIIDNYNASYTYTFTPTTASNSGATITVTDFDENYQVQASNGSCVSDWSIKFMVEEQKETPTVAASGTATICEGESTTITASGYGTATISWDNGLGSNATASVSPTATTTYTVTATENVCSATASVTITVTPKVTPTFDPHAAICEGGTISLPTTSNNGVTGTWNPTVDNTQTTTYTFTPDVSECSTIGTMTVTVNPTPTFTVAGTDPSSCIATDGKITISGLTANTSYDYSYSGGTGTETTNGSGEIVLTNIGAGTYSNFEVSLNGCPGVNNTSITITTPTSPSVIIDGGGTICEGEDITLTAIGSPTGGTYSWNNGGGTNATAVVSPTTTTTYTVTYTLNGCDITNSATITVTPKAIPSFTTPGPICAGDVVSLPTETTGMIGTWNPSIVDNTQTTTYTFTPANGICANTGTVTIVVNPIETPTFVAISPVCEGEMFVLPTTSNNGVTGTWSPAVNSQQTTTYTFTPNNGVACASTTIMTVQVNQKTNPQFEQIGDICIGETLVLPTTSMDGISGAWSPAVNNQQTTTYTFTPNATACSNTSQMTVVINPLPVVTASVDHQTICLGSVIQLDASGAVAYTWDNNLGNGASHIASPTTTTTYTVTGIDLNGCVNTDEVTIDVLSDLDITFSVDTLEGCSPVIIQFTNSTMSGVEYVWDFGDGTSSTLANPSHVYYGDTCFTVSLTVSNGECSFGYTLPEQICIHPTPYAEFAASSYEISDVVNEVTFNNLSQNATSYEWYFGDETGFSTQEHPTYAYDPSIIRNYGVMLVASNEYGCTDTAMAVIKMDEDVTFFVPNTFTPDGDQFNNVFKPIFANGYDNFDYEMLIYDRWGEVIFETHNPDIGWDGVYFFSGKICQEGTYVWKILIRKAGSSEKIEKIGHITLLR